MSTNVPCEHKHSRIKYSYGKSSLFIYAARATRKAHVEEGRLNRTVVSIGEYSTRVERSLDPSMPSTTSNPRMVRSWSPKSLFFAQLP